MFFFHSGFSFGFLEGQMLETMIFSLPSGCVIVFILEITVSRITKRAGSVFLWFLNSGNYFGILGGQKLETSIFFEFPKLKEFKFRKLYWNYGRPDVGNT